MPTRPRAANVAPLEWVIVGGGIHGTLLSRGLLQAGWQRDALRVVDPWTTPLARWRECTDATGMEYLRSPGVHHLDRAPGALTELARACRRHTANRTRPALLGTYQRPSLELFGCHVDHVVARDRLEEVRLQASATGLARNRIGWRVETTSGDLVAKRVILAMGTGDQPVWPSWALPLAASGSIRHIFASGFRRESIGPGRVAVIGAGISALQTATTLAAQRPGEVVVVSRHPLREHRFDSDPCWLGPKCLADFARISSSDLRRAAIQSARHRGSAPADVIAPFRTAVTRGEIELCHGEVEAATPSPSGAPRARPRIALCLGNDTTLSVDQVLLATGFERRRPGAWLDRAIDELGLTVASCGYPVVGPSLQWTRNLYTTGPLAELELGPAARNIAGARMAEHRIAATAA